MCIFSLFLVFNHQSVASTYTGAGHTPRPHAHPFEYEDDDNESKSTIAGSEGMHDGGAIKPGVGSSPRAPLLRQVSDRDKRNHGKIK